MVVPLLVEFVSGDFFLLVGLAVLLLVLALPGLHRLQRGADDSVGRWGTRLAVGGLLVAGVLAIAGDVVGGPQVLEAVVLTVVAIAAVAALIGIVMFAVGMTRAGVFPPSGIWLFLAGMVLFLVSESFEQSLQGPVPALADVLPPTGFIIAGIGLLILAGAAFRQPASASPKAAAMH